MVLRNVFAPGPSKSRRMENVYGYIFPRAMVILRYTTRETGPFPEQANCDGVMVISRRKGGKGCLGHHTSSPRLTPTRRRGIWRQGAPSPRLLAIPRRLDCSFSQQQSQQAGRKWWSMHARTKNEHSLLTSRLHILCLINI